MRTVDQPEPQPNKEYVGGLGPVTNADRHKPKSEEEPELWVKASTPGYLRSTKTGAIKPEGM